METQRNDRPSLCTLHLIEFKELFFGGHFIFSNCCFSPDSSFFHFSRQKRFVPFSVHTTRKLNNFPSVQNSIVSRILITVVRLIKCSFSAANGANSLFLSFSTKKRPRQGLFCFHPYRLNQASGSSGLKLRQKVRCHSMNCIMNTSSY